MRQSAKVTSAVVRPVGRGRIAEAARWRGADPERCWPSTFIHGRRAWDTERHKQLVGATFREFLIFLELRATCDAPADRLPSGIMEFAGSD
jgi:hypothetical protein